MKISHSAVMILYHLVIVNEIMYRTDSKFRGVQIFVDFVVAYHQQKINHDITAQAVEFYADPLKYKLTHSLCFG